MDDYTKQLYQGVAWQYGASAFAEAMGSAINYSSLKADASSARIQAENIELQAQQRANMLREKYNNAVGNVYFSAASRGGKVSSGSVRANLEQSAKNLGEDIASQEKNAKSRADAERMRAKALGKQANMQLVSGLVGSIGSSVKSYNAYQIGYKGGKGNG